jgi:uncharacterized membrane protein
MASVEYILGIFFSILAATLFNLAPIIQKEALDKMQEISFSNMKKSLRIMFTNKTWLLGGLIGLSGSIPFIIAMNLAGVSVVQPVMNFGMIVLIIFAKRKLGEKLNKSAKISIGLMVAMPFLVGLANVSNAKINITETSTRNNMFIFTGIILFLILCCLIMAKKDPIFLTGVVGLFFALGAYYMQAYMSMIAFSGYNFIQNIDSIILRAFTDTNIFIANIYFCILLFFNGLAAYTLQIGLQKVPASKFNPIQQSINNIVSIISGLLIFGQVVNNWFYYSIGIAFGFISIFILGQYQMPQDSYVNKNKESN